MARPPRASSLTTKVTFRLNVVEARRLDELVKRLGFKDRSGLLRELLLHLDPTLLSTGAEPNPREQVNAAKIPADAKNNADETATAHSKRKDAAPQQADYARAADAACRWVALAIYREADERSGWGRIPNAARKVLPMMTPAQFLKIIDALQTAGMVEMSPPNGRYERVRFEDAALCPQNSRGKVLSRARLTPAGVQFIAGILPPKPE